MEYRCWVESGGGRTPIGKMFFAGDVAYWVGEVPTSRCSAGGRDVRRELVIGRGPDRRLRRSGPRRAKPDEPGGADPAGRDHQRDRRGDGAADLDDALAARRRGPGHSPGQPARAVDAGRSAEIAAMFDELAPVYDRLGDDPVARPRSPLARAVVAETRLTPGDSAIDVAAGTGRLAAELADRVGPFGRIVAVDLSPAMVERGTARARDIVQLEFVLGDALALPFDDGRFGAATIAFGLGALADPVAGAPRAAAGRPARRPRRLPRADDAAAAVVGPRSSTGRPTASRRSRCRSRPGATRIAGWRRSSGTSPTPRRSPT